MSSASVLNDTPPPSLPLAKYLSSSDKKTRDKAVRSLAQFLSVPGQQALSPLETAKLWKGIFYCYWMSDKPLVQQALSSELANILLAITSLDQALAFLAGFWEATVREWNGIDRLRMDKYYMLVRKFVNATLRLYRREGWTSALVTRGNDILVRKGGPLCPQDAKVPMSLSFHIAEVFLAELDKLLAEFDADDAGHPAPLLPLLEPYLFYASRTNKRAAYDRIFEEVFTPLFAALSQQALSSQSPSRKRSRLSFESSLDNIGSHSCLETPGDIGDNDLMKLRRGVIQRIFDVANGPDTRESNRKWMVAVWKAEMADESTQKITSLDAT